MSPGNEVAVVTGSSTGIGAALARRLAARGLRVGLIALPNTGLESVADSIRAKGGVVATAEADLGDRSASREAFEQVASDLGPIDLLVLNAGLGGMSPVVGSRDEDGTIQSDFGDRIEDFFRVNVLAAAYAIDAVVPGMIERGRGHVVGTSSLASYRGQPIFTGYTSSKAAFATLLEGLRIELKPKGIAVTIVRPGFVKTPMTSKLPDRLMIGAEEAARCIDEGILARRVEVNFPVKTAILMAIVRALPNLLYDRLATRVILRRNPERRSNPVREPEPATREEIQVP